MLFRNAHRNPFLVLLAGLGPGLALMWWMVSTHEMYISWAEGWLTNYLGYLLAVPLGTFLLMAGYDLARLALRRGHPVRSVPEAPSLRAALVCVGVAAALQFANEFQRVVAGGLWRHYAPWLYAHTGVTFDWGDVVTLAIGTIVTTGLVVMAHRYAQHVNRTGRLSRWAIVLPVLAAACISVVGSTGAAKGEQGVKPAPKPWFQTGPKHYRTCRTNGNPHHDCGPGNWVYVHTVNGIAVYVDQG